MLGIEIQSFDDKVPLQKIECEYNLVSVVPKVNIRT